MRSFPLGFESRGGQIKSESGRREAWEGGKRSCVQKNIDESGEKKVGELIH